VTPGTGAAIGVLRHGHSRGHCGGGRRAVAVYREAGEAVVFVHGNSGSSRDWTALVRETGQFARAVALDMPGFGRASKPRNFDYTVDGYARHLAGALDQMEIRRAHLVLHDFGGPWGLAWAASHPDALASIVLIDIGVPLGYRWHSAARIWQTPVLGELAMALTTGPVFRLAFRRGNPRGVPPGFVERMYRDFDRGVRHAVLRLYRSARDVAREGQRLAEALRPLDRPALVIWGGQDPYAPVDLAERQREVFPDAQLAILDDSGHWPFIDDPEGVMRSLLPFLRVVTGQSLEGHEPLPHIPRQPITTR